MTMPIDSAAALPAMLVAVSLLAAPPATPTASARQAFEITSVVLRDKFQDKPVPERGGVYTIRSDGPEVRLSLTITLPDDLRGTQLYLEVRPPGRDGAGRFGDRIRADDAADGATLPLEIESTGLYEVIVHAVGHDVRDRIILEIESEPDLTAPSMTGIVAEDILGDRYVHPAGSSPTALLGTAPLIEVKTRIEGRRVAILDGGATIAKGTDRGDLGQFLVPIPPGKLATGPHALSASDDWAQSGVSAAVTVVVPDASDALRAVIEGFAATRQAPMQDLDDVSEPVELDDGYVRIRVAKPASGTLAFPVFVRGRAGFAPIGDARVVSDSSSEITLALPRMRDGVEGRLFAVARSGDTQGLASPPLRFVSRSGRPSARVSLRVDAGDRSINSSKQPRLRTNLADLGFTIDIDAPDTAGTFWAELFELQEGDNLGDIAAVIAGDAPVSPSVPKTGGRSWAVAVTGLADDTSRTFVGVAFRGGEVVGKSDPLVVDVRRTGPEVDAVGPKSFGSPGGPAVLAVTVKGPELDLGRFSGPTDAALCSLFSLVPPGTQPPNDGPVTPLPPTRVEYDPASGTLRLHFDPATIRQRGYLLRIAPGEIVDVFGNPLRFDPDDARFQIGDRPDAAVPTGQLPFSQNPTVIRLLRNGEIVDFAREGLGDLDRRLFDAPQASDLPTVVRAWAFPAPARFTLTKFGPYGIDHEEDGAVIYEGMQVVSSPDGRYSIRFVVTAPAMPVTIRLRLLVREQAAHPGSEFQLTLPPIVIPPHRNSVGDFEAASWVVVHSGFSAELARRFVRIDWSRTERSGSARFGSYPTRPGSPFN